VNFHRPGLYFKLFLHLISTVYDHHRRINKTYNNWTQKNKTYKWKWPKLYLSPNLTFIFFFDKKSHIAKNIRKRSLKAQHRCWERQSPGGTEVGTVWSDSCTYDTTYAPAENKSTDRRYNRHRRQTRGNLTVIRIILLHNPISINYYWS